MLFVHAIVKGKKIKEADIGQVTEMFQKIFVIVGLKTIPNDLEGLLLYEHLVKYYGNHTLPEIIMAFELAMTGSLEINVNEVKTYQNFSVLYLSNIIDYYRMWATEKYYRLEHHISPPPENKLLLEEKPNWGEAIEREYQHFILFGDEHYKIWPEYFYNQLVGDGFISHDVFKEQISVVRTKMIAEVIAEREIKSMRKFPLPGENRKSSVKATLDAGKNKIELDKSEKVYHYDPDNHKNIIIEKTRQIVLNEISRLNEIVDDLKSGKRDEEIVIRAKQYSVLLLFKKAKELNRQNIYKKVV